MQKNLKEKMKIRKFYQQQYVMIQRKKNINVKLKRFRIQIGFKISLSFLEAFSRCEEKCNKILIFNGSCCNNLDEIYGGERYKIKRFEHCFQILINKDIIEYFINQKSYIISPSWLKNWRKNIEQMGLNKESAEIFLGNVAKKITLLNTGIYENSISKPSGVFRVCKAAI